MKGIAYKRQEWSWSVWWWCLERRLFQVYLGGKVIGGEEGAYVRARNQLLLKWVPSGRWTRQTAVFLYFLYCNYPYVASGNQASPMKQGVGTSW